MNNSKLYTDIDAKPPAFSGTVERVRKPGIRAFERFEKAADGRGDRIPLHIGQTMHGCPEGVLERSFGIEGELSRQALSFNGAIHTPYSSSNGFERGRILVASYLNGKFGLEDKLAFAADDIVLTNGASDALHKLAWLMVGDHHGSMLAITPAYGNYFDFVGYAGGHLLTIPSLPAEQYGFPPETRFREKIDDFIEAGRPPKAFLVNPTSNPLGNVYRQEDIRMIAKLCLQYGMFCISDEVYMNLVLSEGNKHGSMLQEAEALGDRLVIVGSLSKEADLCGARTGYVASKNKHLIELMSDMAASHLGPNVPGVARLIAYYEMEEGHRESFLSKARGRYREARDRLYQTLSGCDRVILAPKPDGAFYQLLQILDAGGQPLNAKEFGARLLTEGGCMDKSTGRLNILQLTPAAGFYGPHPPSEVGDIQGLVRLAYMLPPDSVEKGAEALLHALK